MKSEAIRKGKMRPLQINITVSDPTNDEILIVSGSLDILKDLLSGVKVLVPHTNSTNESEIVSAFIEESGAELNPIDRKCRTQAQDLYDAYVLWCAKTNHRPMSSTKIAREWTRLGFERTKIAGIQYWTGIKL